MLAVVISTMIVQLVLRGSIHTKHLEQEGFNISSGRETNILRSLTVEEAMSPNILILKENTPLPKLVSLFMEHKTSQCYTVDEKGKLTGVITENELRPIIQEYENLKHFMVAKDLSNPNITTVSANMDLDSVMSRFSKENRDEFPVASANDPNTLIGVISRQNVIDAYNKESFKMNLADGLSEELKTISKNKIASVSDGYSIYEKLAPANFIGKTLAELKLRNTHGLEVLMIKKESGNVLDNESKTVIKIPDANYVIEKGDLLVVFGKDENLHKFAEL
jgi:CIC family chloride channel protein